MSQGGRGVECSYTPEIGVELSEWGRPSVETGRICTDNVRDTRTSRVVCSLKAGQMQDEDDSGRTAKMKRDKYGTNKRMAAGGICTYWYVLVPTARELIRVMNPLKHWAARTKTPYCLGQRRGNSQAQPADFALSR